MNSARTTEFLTNFWENDILPTLKHYITIPNKSPQFDPKWQEQGYMNEAVKLVARWCKEHAVPNMTVETVQLTGRTPLIFINIEGNDDKTVLLYGHLDKQPEMTGWDDELHPFKPILKGDRLYGRGSADDGYAVFASLAAIKALRDQAIPYSRCVIIIECCEESGSFDLPFYIEALKEKIGDPSLIVCLDSGCGNYEQLWLTTSLRGLIGGTLTIDVLQHGIHSGSGSGVVPSPIRILRQLLSRLESESTGDILIKDLFVTIPEPRLNQAEQAAQILGKEFLRDIPFVSGVEPASFSLTENLLRRTWKPALSIIGIDGIPSLANAGNVTLPNIRVKLSLRLPPTCDIAQASTVLKNRLESAPPYGAKIKFELNDSGPGWNAPLEKAWLSQAANEASEIYFDKKAVYMGEGGSIPFMGMLGKKYPQAQFMITGVLGPESNAHGPNEFLHLPYAQKITACVAHVIARHYGS